MKKLISIVVVVVFCSIVVSAQVSVFSKISLESGKVVPTATIFGSKPISSEISFTYFALVKENWAEALIGVNYSIRPSIQFGLSAGLDQTPGLFRAGTSLWIGKGRNSFLALAEKGSGSENYFYKVTLSRRVSEKLNLGLRAWIITGIGPVVEYKYKTVKLWVMPSTKFFGDGGKNVMFGIDVKI